MKYFIATYGCQANKADSERIIRRLENMGHGKTDRIEKAGLVIINACSVRQSAVDRVYAKIYHLQRRTVLRKTEDCPPKIILTGCVLPEDRKKLKNKVSEIWHPDEYFNRAPIHSSKTSAYVPIMTGCNNFCAYCAVPYTRGREESRTVESILTEIRNLAANGWVEITLLGQNVNSYNPTDQNSFSTLNPFQHNFAKLLWEINQIDGLNRIWFTAAHPKDMADEVIAALALDKMANYLHLALQSGSDEVLARMNRRYTADDYLEIIKKVRAVRPEISLGTDIIVGFCGETDEEFQNTVDLYKECDFDIAYLAMYSKRSGTVAGKAYEDDVPLLKKKKRWKILQDLMEQITYKKNQRFLGQTVSVLVDSWSKGMCSGQSREIKLTQFPGDKEMIGKIIRVEVTQSQTWVLNGKFLSYE